MQLHLDILEKILNSNFALQQLNICQELPAKLIWAWPSSASIFYFLLTFFRRSIFLSSFFPSFFLSFFLYLLPSSNQSQSLSTIILSQPYHLAGWPLINGWSYKWHLGSCNNWKSVKLCLNFKLNQSNWFSAYSKMGNSLINF